MTTPHLIDSLATQGFYVWDDFLDRSHIQAIKDSIPENLQDSRIGRRSSLQGNKTVRGDLTLWLDPEMSESIAEYMQKMEEIRNTLNSECYLMYYEILKRIFAAIQVGLFTRNISIMLAIKTAEK